MPLVTQTTNECEHRLNATLFDYISNIVTVLTLRAARQYARSKSDTVLNGHDASPAGTKFVLNEWKWGIGILLVVTQAGIDSAYITVPSLAAMNRSSGRLGGRDFPVSIDDQPGFLQRRGHLWPTDATQYRCSRRRRFDRRSCALADYSLATTPRLVLVKTHRQSGNLNFTHREGEDVLHHLRDV